MPIRFTDAEGTRWNCFLRDRPVAEHDVGGKGAALCFVSADEERYCESYPADWGTLPGSALGVLSAGAVPLSRDGGGGPGAP